VNFISKTPRELNGNSATISLGVFDRRVAGSDLDAGTMFTINGTHARAVNDRWAYKISAGGFTSDAFARPTGLVPGTQTEYPNFANQGTTQPKFDARVDYDAPGGDYKLVLAGGYAGTEGIIHTGIGPFDMQRGVGLGYATLRYTRNALRFSIFSNILNGDATALLSFGPNGQPIPFAFNTRTFDVEFGNVNTVGTRQVISYGGNLRRNNFDLSIAPRGDNRTEIGAYLQDEIFLNDQVRVNLGARFDKFDVIDDVVFSPRVALVLKPLPDHAVRLSYNKAFRSPSLINNYLDVTIVNQLNFARLASINPVFTQLGTFNFLSTATGNENLREESTEVYELGYTGLINDRATVSAAVYFSKNNDEIFFTQVGRYRATNPPAGWLQRLAFLPPQLALGILEALPPACTSLAADCAQGGLPTAFSYRNLGTNRNKGFELGVDAAASRAVNVFANYSFQATPDPDFDISEVNLPPTHRFNAGLSFSEGRFLGNVSVSYVDDAFFQDVLDAQYHGPTEAYTQVNGAFGVRWLNDRLTTTLKVINLGNQDIQSHVFGDIVKRQVLGELRVQF
jgi:outer membrane receptor protein involved in Fe transport